MLVQRQEVKQRFVGRPISRVEDSRFLRGVNKFIGDVKLPNMHYMAILRSSYPHAYVRRIDVSDALRSKGVIGVLTGRDVIRYSRPIYAWWTAKGMKTTDVYCLAVDKVRYVGEPVAAVVAKDKYLAEDALEKITVEYETLEPVVSIEDALKPDAPLLYEDWGNNIMLEYTLEGGDVEQAFKEADYVFEEEISSHRYCAAPLETRCYVAYYEEPYLTVYASSQQPHQTRTVIAKSLNIHESYIRVSQLSLGGGFGAKQPTYHEEVLVPLASLLFKIPVKYVENRRENLTSMHQAREQKHRIKLAVKRDGRIIGIKDDILANLGAYLPTCGPGSVIIAGKTITGCYKIRNCKVKILGVTTNKAPYGAYRGYGKDAGNYVIERMIDIIAKELGIDPIELRLRNIIKPEDLPYRSFSGALYDSGDYPRVLSKALELIEYDKVKALPLGEDKLLGVGVSLTIEPTASHYPGAYMLGYEGATVRIEPTGMVTVEVGSASMGTGHETFIAQIVAEELGLDDVSKVKVIEGDTLTSPYGFGSWASRTTILTGNAVLLAARKVKEKILKIAAEILKEPEDNLTLENNTIHSIADVEKKITLEDVASIMYANKPYPAPPQMEPGLEATAFFFPSNIESIDQPGGGRNTYAAYSNSAHAAIVEVDRETGYVKVLKYVVVTDCGRVVNPLIAEGQVVGGVVQGIGGVIYEENIYDENGNPLATTFMDYLIPTSIEAPKIKVAFIESPSPFNQLGVKGVGEGPIEGVPATIANAVENALREYNVKITSLPLTPENVWKLVRKSR